MEGVDIDGRVPGPHACGQLAGRRNKQNPGAILAPVLDLVVNGVGFARAWGPCGKENLLACRRGNSEVVLLIGSGLTRS